MFRSLLAKTFTTLVTLIALSGITIRKYYPELFESKVKNFVLVFLKIFSSFRFHTKMSIVLAGEVCEIFVIEKCICSKRQRELLLT